MAASFAARLLSSRHLEALRAGMEADDYAVLDNVVSRAEAAALAASIDRTHADGVARPNVTRFMTSATAHTDIAKPGIHECDLFDGAARAGDPALAEVWDGRGALAAALAEALPALRLRPDAAGTSVKTQYNDGTGGCFPLHFDNAGPPSKRKLTCLV